MTSASISYDMINISMYANINTCVMSMNATFSSSKFVAIFDDVFTSVKLESKSEQGSVIVYAHFVL